MTKEADRFWQEVEKGLARKTGFASLTPEQAEKQYDELPEATLSDSEINSIIEEVTSGELTDWTPRPVDAPPLDADSEVIEDDVYQLNRNAGEGDAETDELLNELRRKAFEDESKDDQENEAGMGGNAEPPGEGD